MKWSAIPSNKAVRAVIVFGSTGRGDSDKKSDTDLFILCANDAGDDRGIIRDELAQELGCDPLSITAYTEKEFQRMLERGSLFAWHLKLEGKLVFTKADMGGLFANLRPYSRHCEDIALYSKLLSDCRASITENGVNAYDLAQVFTVARNCCMVVCHKLGNPKFGRLSAYYACRELIGKRIALTEANYLLLCQWKLCYERAIGPNAEIPSGGATAAILREIEDLLKHGAQICSVC